MDEIERMGQSLNCLAAARLALSLTWSDIAEDILHQTGWCDDEAIALYAADRRAFFEQLVDRLANVVE